MCVALPVPFVRYLTELGNGGVGADYGIYPLDSIRKGNSYAALTKDLPPMLDHSLTDAQWTAPELSAPIFVFQFSKLFVQHRTALSL